MESTAQPRGAQGARTIPALSARRSGVGLSGAVLAESQRNLEEKCRTRTNHGFEPNASAHQFNDGFALVQSDIGSAINAAEQGVAMPESLEDAALIARLNAGAGTRDAPIVGAGRELHQTSRFDPGGPEERDAIKFYELLAKTVRDSGAQLEIVYFPLSYGVHPQDESRWRHLGLKDVQAQKAYDAAFMRYLNKRDIPGIDISDALRRAAGKDRQRLYYWLDIHWTPQGNAAAAWAVSAALSGP